MADAGKKPMKVIKEGDMSPETKALPDEVVAPPKGIGESEKDMDPIPKKAAPKVIPMTKEDKKVLNSSKFKKASEATVDKKKGGMIKTKKYSKGGTASSRADGIATKGKTRGKIC